MGFTVYKWRSKCQFGFKLDHIPTRQTIRAGECLRGSVVFQVSGNIPPTQLVLRLTGKEKVKIESRRDTHRAERRLCETTIILRRENEWDGDGITPGTYEFPFNLPLPSTLPSSTDYGSNWAIEYKLKVDLGPSGHPSSRGVAQRIFAITAAPVPNITVPATIAPKLIRVSSHCGFVERGMIAIAARVADVQVSKGTDLEIFLAVTNHASASIYRVQVELVEKFFYTVRGLSDWGGKTLACRSNVDLPGIIRGKQDKELVKKNISRGTPRSNLAALYEELQLDQNRVILRVPWSCRDSYSSDLIRVEHTLKITTHTKDLVSNPSVIIPLQVSHNHLPMSTESNSPLASTPDRAEAIVVQASNHPRGGQSSADDITIPIAEAVAFPVSDNSIRYPMATAPLEAIVVGGMAPYEYAVTDNDGESDPPSCPGNADSRQQPLAARSDCDTNVSSPNPSVEVLLEEMMYSVDDYDIIDTKLQDSSTHNSTLWRSALSSISPEEFGSILAHVHRDFDQPRVAVLLARLAIKKGRFTCDYGRAAVLNSVEWNRPMMVRQILPHCIDRLSNSGKIREILSDWERIVTRDLFDLDDLDETRRAFEAWSR